MINLYKGGPPRTEGILRSNLLFMFDCHSNQTYLLFNSLGPSSSTHSLQIYCIGFIGPISHMFWAWTVNRDPTISAVSGKNLRDSENNGQL